MSERSKNDAGFGKYGFCSFTYSGHPNLCRQCGNLLHEAAVDTQRLVDDRFRRIWWRKARSDTLFLLGLLVGGAP